MQRCLDRLIWVLVITTITGTFYLASPPDVEATLGIPACANRAHAGPCRYCMSRGNLRLPRVIDETNVHFIIPACDVADR